MEDKNMCGGDMGMMKHHMCKKIIFVVIVIALIFVCGKTLFNDNNDIQKDTIVVSGKGELTVKPDIATVSFSVMEENMDVSKATDAVNKQITNVITALKADGVEEKDIKTTGYSVYPRYDYINTPVSSAYPYGGGGKQVLAGYDVTQSIEVKIRDLSKAGKVVTDLGTLKVTNISGLNFTNDKYDDLVKQARDEAITNARAEATKLAKALGVRLVKIIGYSEGGSYPYPVKYDSRTVSMGSSMKSEAVLPTGENKITSNVSITYEIK
ncbi:MAG: SIMPL domain-containing protein [Candidatus Paceibacterota bacterium]|jgi:hypothetical protein